MAGDMLRPVMMIQVVFIFAIIAKSVIDYMGRRHLAAKGALPEDRELEGPKAARWSLMSSLKWALICIGFGAAVILYDSLQDVLSMTGGFGLMFLGAGLGYLVYFLIAWQWFKKEGHRDE